jgi:AraC-like DNA-binding protein
MEVSITLKNSRFSLDEQQKNKIESALQAIIEENKAFICPKYNLSRLSYETNFSTNQLSAFFNQIIGLHYNDYINKYRIDYCILLFENEETQNLTLEGLSKKCGFHNRNTFISAFKKFVGVNPSEYLRNKKNEFLAVTSDKTGTSISRQRGTGGFTDLFPKENN